jgi:3-methylfumaryl-CoA hydratase
VKETLADLAGYVGKSIVASDVVTAAGVAQLAATFGIDPPAREIGAPLPPGWHGPFFVPTHGPQNMREDGQPSGGFLPVIPLPIQRLRGENTRYPGVLHIGDVMTRTSEIAEIDVDDNVDGGPVVSLMFRQTISTAAGIAVIEERRFMYFGMEYVLDTSTPPLPEKHDWEQVIDPDPVTLFRFSAIRFNSHRIHYDRRYTVDVEGHPGLIVQGTLINHLMVEMARGSVPGKMLRGLDFRIHKPVYDTGPFSIRGARNAGSEGAKLWAHDADGVLSMTADAAYAD